jgi:hypothetical protein
VNDAAVKPEEAAKRIHPPVAAEFDNVPFVNRHPQRQPLATRARRR